MEGQKMVQQQNRNKRTQTKPNISARSDTKRAGCGAKTRKGTTCLAKALPGKRRCKLHGGMSTGPKTRAGKERIAELQRKRWEKWRRERWEPDIQTPEQQSVDIET